MLRKIRHLTEITHPELSSETSSRTAEKLSLALPGELFCSVTGFDESVFQLCIYKDGGVLTVHQIGEELPEMGMDKKTGDVGILSSFFLVPESTVTEFLKIEDVMDAEDFLFDKIIKGTQDDSGSGENCKISPASLASKCLLL